MKRYVCAFALFGFLAVIVTGFFEDAPLGDLLPRAFKWGTAFAVLGLALGWAAKALLDETRIGEEFDRSGSATLEARKRTDEVDLMAQDLMAREVDKSPILLQSLQRSAEKNDGPSPLVKGDQGE